MAACAWSAAVLFHDSMQTASVLLRQKAPACLLAAACREYDLQERTEHHRCGRLVVHAFQAGHVQHLIIKAACFKSEFV